MNEKIRETAFQKAENTGCKAVPKSISQKAVPVSREAV